MSDEAAKEAAPESERVERHLVLVSPAIPGRHLVADLSVVTIGRAKECTIVVDHEAVSRCHVRLSTDGVLWTVADLDSRNGTRVNDKRLLPSEPRMLETGDVIERAVALSGKPLLLPEDLPPNVRPDPNKRLRTLDEVERDYILEVLRETRGNKQAAAQILHIDRKTLQRKAQRYQIQIDPD